MENYFCQLLTVYGVYDIRQRERHAAELFVSDSSCLEVQITVETLIKYKSPGIRQIPAKLIQQEAVHYLLKFTNLLILF
jgi:hypothetical protein